MEYLLKASAVIAIFYLCFYFFLKKETFFNHNRWFLLIGVVIALIFPFVVIPIHIAIEPVLIPETVLAISENIPVNIQTLTPEPKFEWQTFLPIIYGIGLAIFLIKFLFQFGSLILLLLKNPNNKDGIYTYVIVNNKISPFSFFKWIVYNPESFNVEELKLMLTHEKVHANQLHSIDILLIQLACSIFWFNPLMWFYRKEVRQNLEYIADFKTQTISKDEKEYQRLLLKTSVVNHNISISNNFYNSLIKERIVMLKKSRSNTKKQWRTLLMLPLLAGLLMSMNTEKVYIETASNVEKNDDIIAFVVTKNTTDKELKAMSNTVENKGGTLIFSQIKRNDSNELTSIFLKLYNHSYGNGNSSRPIERFLIYKELFGLGGGYAGTNGMGTMHFDDNTNGDNPESIKAFKTRTNKVLLKNQLTALNLNNKTINVKETIEIIFTKETTDKQLDVIKRELKSQGVTMAIKRLKRNDKNEIVDINLDFKTEKGSANYNVQDKNGINAFYFNMKDNGSFGVGAISDDVHVIETIHESHPKKLHSKHKNNVFILKTGENHEEIIEDRIHNNKVRIINGKANHGDSIYVVKGRNVVRGYRTNSDNDTIHVIRDYKIDSTNVKTGYFYQSDGPVKIISSEENITTYDLSKPNQNSYVYRIQNKPTPLYIVDGKVINTDDFDTINPENIESLTVLKGESAIKGYGDKGKNGVLVITTKNLSSETSGREVKEKNPWRVEVTSTTYIDDEYASKNGTLAYITKHTSDEVLETHKTNLKKFGIDVKYNKLKRNKLGEITSIKISIKNKKGAQSSAAWKVDDGIPSIEFGETEGSLIARTSEMN